MGGAQKAGREKERDEDRKGVKIRREMGETVIEKKGEIESKVKERERSSIMDVRALSSFAPGRPWVPK